jgi:hypothetical protein
VIGSIEPGSTGALRQLLEDPRLAPGKHAFQPSTLLLLASLFIPTILRGILSILLPERGRRLAFAGVDQILAKAKQVSLRAESLAAQLSLLDKILADTPLLMIKRLIPAFAPGIAMLNLLNNVSNEVSGGENLTLSITRGMPNNVTTEMDRLRFQGRSIGNRVCFQPGRKAGPGLPYGCFAGCRSSGDRALHGTLWHARGCRARPGPAALA